MNVQQLIDALQKVEDKTMEVEFSYDHRAGGRQIHCVDIEKYLESESRPTVVFREDTFEEYQTYAGYVMTPEQFEAENKDDPMPTWWDYQHQDETSQPRWEQERIKRIEQYADRYKRFHETYEITNLFLEHEE